MAGIELNPLRRKHEIYMLFVFIAPKLQHFAQVELSDDLVCSYQSIHISLQTELSID